MSRHEESRRSDREALLYLVSLIKVYAGDDPPKGTGPRRPAPPA